MNLPPELVRYLNEVQKRQRRWRWERWVFVSCGSLFVGVAVFAFCFLWHHETSGTQDRFFEMIAKTDTAAAMKLHHQETLMVVIQFVSGVMLLSNGIVFLVLAIGQWRVREPRNAILLKLVEEAEKAAPKP